MMLWVTALPRWLYFPEPSVTFSVGIQVRIVLPILYYESSHCNKLGDDLMQDEKRQHPISSFSVPHGIYFPSTLIILRSIKACNKSRCIPPWADSTCERFLSLTPIPGPPAKHDYPILMRFLMWLFFYFFQFQWDNPVLCYVHTMVNVCSLMVCKRNSCWHYVSPPVCLFDDARVLFLTLYVWLFLIILQNRKNAHLFFALSKMHFLGINLDMLYQKRKEKIYKNRWIIHREFEVLFHRKIYEYWITKGNGSISSNRF